MPRSSVSSHEHEPEHHRTLIHEPEYDQAVAHIFKTVRRGDDVLIGLEIWISQRAELGMAYRPTAAPNIATWCSKPLPEGQIRVLYRFDDETVNLIDAWLLPNFPEPGRYR